MKTSEIEQKLKVSKHTILYYEKEGLLHPTRDENEYRNYTEEDMQRLQLIKLLRSMEIPIDDIKLVLHGSLDIQDCLKTQESYIQQSIDTLHETKEIVKTFKEKDIPIIPALASIETIKIAKSLGYQKTTKTVTIGRRLTKALLLRNMYTFIFLAIAVAVACYYGFKDLVGSSMLWIAIVIAIAMVLIQLFALASGLGLMKTISIESNPINFIEFGHDGIKYYKKGKITKQILYFKDILKNQEVLTNVRYEDIDKVIISHVTRYMKIPGTNLPVEMGTTDYTLYFVSGESYFISNGMILDNDQQYIAMILQEKVANIEEVNRK